MRKKITGGVTLTTDLPGLQRWKMDRLLTFRELRRCVSRENSFTHESGRQPWLSPEPMACPYVQVHIASFPTLSSRMHGPNSLGSHGHALRAASARTGEGSIKRLLVGGERASHYIPPVIVGYQGCLFLKSHFSRSHVVSFPGFGLREELSHMGKPKILLSPKNTAMRHPRTQFETASALAPTQHDAPTVQPQHCARVAMQRQQDVGSVYGISSAR